MNNGSFNNDQVSKALGSITSRFIPHKIQSFPSHYGSGLVPSTTKEFVLMNLSIHLSIDFVGVLGARGMLGIGSELAWKRTA